MITIVKEFTFDSAHYLPGYAGACAFVHGHTYRLMVGMQGEVGKDGMVMDFSALKKFVEQTIINQIDHLLLNKITYEYFPKDMPTAEKMVVWMQQTLSKHMKDTAVRLVFIRLYETPTSYAEWRGEVA